MRLKHKYIRRYVTHSYALQVMHPQSGSSSVLHSPKENIKDMGVLSTLILIFNICTLGHIWPMYMLFRQWKPQSGSSSVLHSPNKDMKDRRVLGTLIFNLWDWHFKRKYIRTYMTHSDTVQIMKPQSGSSSVLHSPNKDMKDRRVLHKGQLKFSFLRLKKINLKLII